MVVVLLVLLVLVLVLTMHVAVNAVVVVVVVMVVVGVANHVTMAVAVTPRRRCDVGLLVMTQKVMQAREQLATAAVVLTVLLFEVWQVRT